MHRKEWHVTDHNGTRLIIGPSNVPGSPELFASIVAKNSSGKSRVVFFLTEETHDHLVTGLSSLKWEADHAT